MLFPPPRYCSSIGHDIGSLGGFAPFDLIGRTSIVHPIASEHQRREKQNVTHSHLVLPPAETSSPRFEHEMFGGLHLF